LAVAAPLVWIAGDVWIEAIGPAIAKILQARLAFATDE